MTKSNPVLLLILMGCQGESDTAEPGQGHGPYADQIMGPLGTPFPFATEAQVETFERGLAAGKHQYSLSEGLGPGFNVTFCLSCHEQPVFGGSASLYRNFVVGAEVSEEGVFFFAESAGNNSGVIRSYYYGSDFDQRPTIGDEVNHFAHRNPVPFFGIGLIAELSDTDILVHADPDDLDQDGISGRANYDDGFIGRFGLKAQTASIEGFIRGPLFNHVGITSDPLTNELRAELPVDSSSVLGWDSGPFGSLERLLLPYGQAAAPSVPLVDEDDAPDPEMDSSELFDLVSYAMLLAAPEFEDISSNTEALEGRRVFNETGCDSCHIPRLDGPRGAIPLYSDLLLHDMGEDLDDGLLMKEALGSEFRTQPLWGISVAGPYLHDGRAQTIEEAILWHGGEAEASRDAYSDCPDGDKAALEEFLLTLGGRSQFTTGLLAPDAEVEPVGSYGGPLETTDAELFSTAREMFDHNFGYADGVGGPRFNGDSCRACHFEPTIGGAGPQGVNVMRHAIVNDSGNYVAPAVGSILHKNTSQRDGVIRAQTEASFFEARQTPHLYGLGAIDGIPEEIIMANADPDDSLDGDGITGRVSYTAAGKVGRFGWKASVPSLSEFIRDAVTVELGMTVDYEEGSHFGQTQDNDAIADPEFSADQQKLLLYYLENLGPPPRQEGVDEDLEAQGEQIFADLECSACHIPSLEGDSGPVPLYSDLLLHEILPEGSLGIEEASANMREFRTPPLWGVSQTAPYLHDGRAATFEQAIDGHAGEGDASREAYQGLSDEQQAALTAFLETL